MLFLICFLFLCYFYFCFIFCLFPVAKASLRKDDAVRARRVGRRARQMAGTVGARSGVVYFYAEEAGVQDHGGIYPKDPSVFIR